MTRLAHVILVDDEPLAREGLREYIAVDERLELIAEAGDGRSAIEAIRRLSPDLVFLDIQMPECDGFAVMTELGSEMPPTILVTAYDQYALKAFELYAVDYLLKPWEPDRIQAAIQRALDRLNSKSSAERTRLHQLVDELAGKSLIPGRLVVRSTRGLLWLDHEEVQWIEAAGNYIKIHTGEDTHLIRMTLGSVLERLPQDQFVRVHRSYVVSTRHIRELRTIPSSPDVTLKMRSGVQLPVGRSYRSSLPRLQ